MIGAPLAFDFGFFYKSACQGTDKIDVIVISTSRTLLKD